METIVWAEPVTYINHRHSVASWLLTWIYVRWANTHYDTALENARGA